MKDGQSSLDGPKNINQNITYIEEKLNHSDDIQKRTFNFLDSIGTCIFLDTLVDNVKLERNFFEQLPLSNSKDLLEVITASDVSVTEKIDDVPKAILQGKAALFLEGQTRIIVFAASSRLERSIEEPSNEKVVRGSHDGFNETLLSNIHLIRSIVKTGDLTVKYFLVGKETNSKIALVYLNSIANQDIVLNITTRIQSISADMVFSPGFTEEFLEDQPLSPFPQMLNTERPDRVMANLLDGRIALLSDGSPTALILPVSFFSFYQSPDDYNSRFLAGSFYRIIRTIGFFIALFVPAGYIATVAFHFEVIPAELVMQIKSSIETVPYPPIIEALIMELTIELIREAGVRLPSPIGQTIGIVGGLVIGDAVVKAGLVSNIMIIVVAITAIASFVVPSAEMNTTLRIIRFPFMFAAATFGYFGIAFCFTLLLIHLCKLETFGSPYFAPFAPLQPSDLKDTFLRWPIWKMKKRPKATLPNKVIQEQNSRGWQKNDRKE